MKDLKPKYHDVDQNSLEWLQIRCGKVTSSKFAVIMANYPKAFGDPAKRYAEKLAVERETGLPVEEFQNAFMERGHELEPFARQMYERDNFTEVSTCGIFTLGDIGSSPDGLVGEDGLVEIKSVVYNVQFDRLRNGGIDPKYKWQVQGELMVTGRNWVDYVQFCPEMPESKQLYVCRVYPDQNMFSQLQDRIKQFELLISKNQKLLQ